MKIPVKDIYKACRAMIDEKYGYIWGTAGVMCTKEVLDKAINNPRNPNPELTEQYGKQWLGHMVVDCSGAIVKIWKDHGLTIPHGSTSMVTQKYIINCGSTPHPGWAALVDPTPETPDNNHIGIVMDDGVTIFEARGTRYGCIYSSVNEKKWTKYGQFKDVAYEEIKPMNTPYIAKVSTASGPLNVRSGPSTEYQKIGSVAKDSEVKVMIHQDQWDFINQDDLQGYVNNQYLTPVREIDPEPVKDDIVIPKQQAEVFIQQLQTIIKALQG